jgi:hypothetical protein
VANQLLGVDLVVLLVLLLLLNLDCLLLRLHVLLLLLAIFLRVDVVFRACSLLFVRAHDKAVVIRAARINLPAVQVADHLTGGLRVSLEVSSNVLRLLVGLLPVAKLARSRLRHDDILDVVVDGQIDGWFLHFHLFVSAHYLLLLGGRRSLGWVLWTCHLAIDKGTYLGSLVDCAVGEASRRMVVVVLRL